MPYPIVDGRLPAEVVPLPMQSFQARGLGCTLHVVVEAHVDVLLLNVMGSAAIASAVVAAVIATRLSRELAGLARDEPASGSWPGH